MPAWQYARVRALVTGAAGFIGSHLAQRLVDEGHTVRGVDCFTPYYPESDKRANLERLQSSPGFTLEEADLRTADLGPLLEGVDAVFHQSAQPGVRLSWSEGFALYVEHNVLATQRLLEAVRDHSVSRLVFASSSSVYGNAPTYPTSESDLPRPYSPYGVTKLAAEHLCLLYAGNWGIPAVCLRYFTVYGPRQRPDMATHRLIEACLGGAPFPLFGDGSQIRDFTYVEDVVSANVAAATADVAPGTVVNVAGGSSCTLAHLVALVGELAGREVPLDRRPGQAGDVERTGGSIEQARRALGWEPRVDLRTGVGRQLEWHRRRRAGPGTQAPMDQGSTADRSRML
jgi:nucleoside-diphosphate-sugar epimerase